VRTVRYYPLSSHISKTQTIYRFKHCKKNIPLKMEWLAPITLPE